eukprot:CAMPEP_0115148812 /NCGR_PEP_ID=MMETSP0227-20121206/64093_1 /TAXON_ID=89957 /ORGANISM="Polarella glacialis, Strain CCMP 1383" /LENGTH=661 /DNA_ID=CAMNT_0002558911 /DNA_START=60 /DNA_END=2046 /DNA_ORIENTATION=+
MAKVISNQLNIVLSTRVAFLTICIVVVLPVFNLFIYPETDDSMSAWAELLNRNAEKFRAALLAGNSSQALSFGDRLTYGPFFICYGEKVHHHYGGSFDCKPDELTLNYASVFSKPRRLSNIRQVDEAYVSIQFDMSTTKTQESASGIVLICFIVVIMSVFGMLMSKSIAGVALVPLERMLNVVRERCKEIFKYTTELKDDESEEEDDDEFENEDLEHNSEFQLLEKVVAKLAAIANLSSANAQPEMHAGMTENEIMTLNWMQGAQISSSYTPSSKRPSGVMAVDETHNTPRCYSAMLSKIPQDSIEQLDTAFFDANAPAKDLKIALATYMVTYHEGCANWVQDNVPDAILFKFMSTVEAKYPTTNAFHNYSHGIDVLYSVSRHMRMTSSDSFLSDTSQFLLLIASIAHDVGHLGVNNQYLVETNHELAVKYNDRSPIAMLFQIASSSPDLNIWVNVGKSLYQEMRKGIIAAILHTDMLKHNDMMKELTLLYQMNSESFDNLKPADVVMGHPSNAQLLMNALLHGADIGNPMKPWKLCEMYAHACLDEFFAQGDMEKAAGVPVQMLNDREKVNRPNSQVGFIEFVICPMCESLVNLFPQLDHLAEDLAVNVTKWSQLWIDEAQPSEEAAGKVKARVEKISTRCQAVCRDFRGIQEHTNLKYV